LRGKHVLQYSAKSHREKKKGDRAFGGKGAFPPEEALHSTSDRKRKGMVSDEPTRNRPLPDLSSRKKVVRLVG